jgi:hypothetical protein
MAGTGQSTIARTVATAFHDRTHLTDKTPPASEIFLGASFFFNQTEADRNNARKFFATLSRRLAEVLPDLKGYICDAIAECGDSGLQSLRNQWKYLIFQPF